MNKKNFRAYVKTQKPVILKTAEEGFNRVGRGAVLLDLSGPMGETKCGYATSEQLKQVGSVYDKIHRRLAKYDPVREIVIVIILEDGFTHAMLKMYPLAE